MKKVLNIKGNGRLPFEYCEMRNFNNVYEEIPENDDLMIAFLESYGGEYEDTFCKWVLIED